MIPLVICRTSLLLTSIAAFTTWSSRPGSNRARSAAVQVRVQHHVEQFRPTTFLAMLESCTADTDTDTTPNASLQSYNLLIDTRIVGGDGMDTRNTSGKKSFVDGAFVSDLLLEVFGAQTVVAKNAADDTQEIYDEPDVDYSFVLAEEHEASGVGGISQSLNLLPDDNAPAFRRKREAWTHSELVARMTCDCDVHSHASDIIDGMQDMLSNDGDGTEIKLDYRIEMIDIEEEQGVDWCKQVQQSWPPSLVSHDVVAALLVSQFL